LLKYNSYQFSVIIINIASSIDVMQTIKNNNVDLI
jgi:hypothetical protein